MDKIILIQQFNYGIKRRRFDVLTSGNVVFKSLFEKQNEVYVGVLNTFLKHFKLG